MKMHETRFRVRYAETDQMGVVYYANYFIWMEIGRTEYCRAEGARYSEMEREGGILLAVADAHCRYAAPARYDDDIRVTTHISSANRRMVVFDYLIHNEAGQRLASGHTKHVFLNPQFKPIKLPEQYFSIFGISG